MPRSGTGPQGLSPCGRSRWLTTQHGLINNNRKGSNMLITKQGVATMLAVHPNTVDNLRRDNSTFPPPVRLAERTLRWLKSDIERWVDGHKQQAPVPTRAKGAAERLGI